MGSPSSTFNFSLPSPGGLERGQRDGLLVYNQLTIPYLTARLHSVLVTTHLPPWFQLLYHHLGAHLVQVQGGPTNLLEEATHCKDSSRRSRTSFSSSSQSSWGQTLLQTLAERCIGFWTNVALKIGKHWMNNTETK